MSDRGNEDWRQGIEPPARRLPTLPTTTTPPPPPPPPPEPPEASESPEGADWPPPPSTAPPAAWPPPPSMAPPVGWPPPEWPPASPPTGPGGGWSPPAPGGDSYLGGPPPATGGWPPPPGGPPTGGWPPPGQPYGGYQPQGAAAPTEPLSIWSLVLGIFSFFICPLVGGVAALITGSKAKKAIDASGGTKGGRGMAVAGQVLGVIGIVASVVVAGAVVAIVALSSHHIAYTKLTVGDCYNRETSGAFADRGVTRVSCNSSHLGEVVATFEAADGPWPGSTGIGAVAGPRCDDATRQYTSALPSDVDVYFLFPPTQRSWDNGNHTIVCEVHKRDGSKRVGSVKS